MISTIIKGMLSLGKGCSIEGRVVVVDVLWVFYLYLMGLGLGSVVWDTTGGWSCDKIIPLLRAPAEARVICYSTWMGLVPGGWQSERGE